MYNFETFNEVLERSHRPSINRMKKMGKKVARKLASHCRSLEQKGVYQENITTIFFLKFPLLLIKTTTLLEVRKHFQYASLCRFGNSTLERIQFGRERSQKKKKKIA